MVTEIVSQSDTHTHTPPPQFFPTGWRAVGYMCVSSELITKSGVNTVHKCYTLNVRLNTITQQIIECTIIDIVIRKRFVRAGRASPLARSGPLYGRLAATSCCFCLFSSLGRHCCLCGRHWEVGNLDGGFYLCSIKHNYIIVSAATKDIEHSFVTVSIL